MIAPGRARRVALAALLVLVIAALAGARLWQLRRSAPAPGVELQPSERAIDEALRAARGDSASATAAAGEAEDKNRWLSEVKGFDVSGLDPRRRERFVRSANLQRCTCGCGYTLAGCRAYDPTCPVSGPRVQKLLDSVQAGRDMDAPATRPKRPRRG